MIQVINRKIYNTDTATMVCGMESPWKSILYKTSKGAYFVYNNGPTGQEIRVLTTDGAIDWLCAFGKIEIALREFPGCITEA